MNLIFRSARFLVVLALTIVSAVLAGSFSNRWGQPVDLIAAGREIDALPHRLGDWNAESIKPLRDDVVELLQCTGHTARIYQNRQTGAMVSMALIVGPPGPTSVHTPDVCFTSSNYLMAKPPRELKVRPPRAAGGTFWDAIFRSTNVGGDRLRVLYSWNDGGHWVAAARPRFEFAGAPLLYKLQLAAGMEADADGTEAEDGMSDFLAELLPALDQLTRRTSSN